MSLNVKKGDNVVILAGKDKGRTGKIVSVKTTTAAAESTGTSAKKTRKSKKTEEAQA